MSDSSSPRFVPAQVSGDLLFVSGQVPRRAGELLARGRLGEAVSLEVGRECARQCAENVLDVVERTYGSLDVVSKIVKLTVFVSSSASFTEQPQVADAASDLFLDALGARGRHARTAVGVASLPLGVPVEVEAVVALQAS